MPIDPAQFLNLTVHLLPSLKGRRAADLASRGLEIALGSGIGPSRDATLATLLEAAGKELNGSRAIRIGLAASVPLEPASRNLVKALADAIAG